MRLCMIIWQAVKKTNILKVDRQCFQVSNGSSGHCTECVTTQRPNQDNSRCVDIELEPHLYR